MSQKSSHLQTLCNLTDFQNICTAGKRMKFATKPIRHYPLHLRYVATLPWEIKNSNFLQIFSRYEKMQTNCILVANFASLSLHWLQIKFFKSLFCCLFTFAINLWHQEFITADATAVFVNSQHGIQRRRQDFDINFICNQYGERLAILNTENIKICRWIRKLEAIKMHLVCISAIPAEFMQKIWILTFPKVV